MPASLLPDRQARSLAAVAGLIALLATACAQAEDAERPGAASSSSSAPGPPPPEEDTTLPSPRPGPTGLMAATDGRRTRVVARIDVGTNPCGVLVAYGAAWVTDAAESRLRRISLATNEVVASYPVDDTPCELTAAEGSLWVTTQSGRVDRLDPDTGRITARVRTGSASYETIAAAGALWVSNRGDGTITRINPDTEMVRNRNVGTNAPGGLVAADGYLWVGTDAPESTSVRRIDPKTWAITEVETGGRRPAWLAVTPGRVWVAHMSSATVVGLDTGTLEPIGAPASAGFSPVNLEATPDGQWVWVPDDYDNLLTRIDAGTGDAVERVEVGSGPAVVTASNEEVWVTNFGDGTVWRLRIGAPR